MISLSATFDYHAIIPESKCEGGFECRAATRRPLVRSVSNANDKRLVGLSPQLRVTGAGLPTTPGLRPPWSLRKRSCITLVATARDQASFAEASFYIDETFTASAKAGDHIYLAMNGSSSLAFSLIRGGKLLAAAGALTAVPLGRGVEVRIPHDLISAAESVFQKRDPEFEFIEHPVEIKIEGSRERYGQSALSKPQNPLQDTFISAVGGADIGDYRVLVRRGVSTCEGHPSESLSICNKHMFTHAAGESAAMLLDDREAFSLSNWPK